MILTVLAISAVIIMLISSAVYCLLPLSLLFVVLLKIEILQHLLYIYVYYPTRIFVVYEVHTWMTYRASYGLLWWLIRDTNWTY